MAKAVSNLNERSRHEQMDRRLTNVTQGVENHKNPVRGKTTSSYVYMKYVVRRLVTARLVVYACLVGTVRAGRMDGPTHRRTDGPTDGHAFLYGRGSRLKCIKENKYWRTKFQKRTPLFQDQRLTTNNTDNSYWQRNSPFLLPSYEIINIIKSMQRLRIIKYIIATFALINNRTLEFGTKGQG